MNDEHNTNPKKPDFIAYTVTNDKDGKGHFNKIGAAWSHRDHEGYDVQLDSLPVNGRVSLRTLRQNAERTYQDERATREPQHDRQIDRER